MYHTIVTLKKGEGRTIKAGGMWIYDNEIESVVGDFENGNLVAVHDFDGYFLGYGFLNMHSKTRVRLMSRRKEYVIDEAFPERRVRDAWEYRKNTCDTGCCRLIFGEADFLPGLVVDKFSDVLAVESLALGIDRLKPAILEILQRVLAEDGIRIRGIYERSDAKVREQEGMERHKGFIGKPFDTKVEINPRGMKLIKNGGFLATCSCSHFMVPDPFQKTIKEAARSAHKRLRQVEFRTQACDHPILWAADQSYYLKFYIFQVCEDI